MNKLEEIRDKVLPLEGEESSYIDWALLKREGFDAAIALDLAVKFDLWRQKEEADEEGLISLADYDRYYVNPSIVDLPKHCTTKELYQYWLENIFKIE